MIGTIALKEFKEIMRDGRIKFSALIIGLMLVASFATAAQRYADISVERESAQAIVAEQWLAQGEKNPHAAAHYGVYAFKTVSPLSFFDTGVGSYTGVSVWLEAHKQNDAEGQPAKDATSIARFGELTAAFTLQLLLPLLVILLAFPAFAGERDNGTLRQLMSMGVKSRDLLFGKALGVGASLFIFVGPILLLGLAALLVVPEGPPYLGHGVLLLLNYLVYAVIFLFLTLAVSAYVSSAKTALALMVGLWAITTFVVPRLAADVSYLANPTPTAYEFQKAITEELEMGLDGVSPDSVVKARREQTLSLYNTDRVEDLPINFQGIIFDIQEELGNQVFDKHYSDLHATYQRQVGVHQLFSLFSPRLAARLASMELAGTSLRHDLEFLRQAENYRRELISTMNRDLTYNSKMGQADYRADANLWAQVEAFEFQPLSLTATLQTMGPNFMVLLIWLGVSVSAAIIAANRLRVMAG